MTSAYEKIRNKSGVSNGLCAGSKCLAQFLISQYFIEVLVTMLNKIEHAIAHISK